MFGQGELQSKKRSPHSGVQKEAISVSSEKITLGTHRNCRAVKEACNIPAPKLESGPVYCRFAGSCACHWLRSLIRAPNCSFVVCIKPTGLKRSADYKPC